MGLRTILRGLLRPAQPPAPAPVVETMLTVDGEAVPMTPEYERLLRRAEKLAAEHPEAGSLTVNGLPAPMTPELAELVRKALQQREKPPA